MEMLNNLFKIFSNELESVKEINKDSRKFSLKDKDDIGILSDC